MTYIENNDVGGGEEAGGLHRRRFLQATGAVGIAAGFTGLSGQLVAQDDAAIKLEAVRVMPRRGAPDQPGRQNNRRPYRTWIGISPEEIEDEENPTLELVDGRDYVVEWTNTERRFHNFVVEAADGETVFASSGTSEEGATETVRFTATEEMAAYYCSAHPVEMRGTIQIGEAPPEERILDVLYLGGVEDGAAHYSEDLYQVLGPYLLERGIRTHYTERQDDLNPETLSNYDAVMLYGNRLEATEEQIDALESFVEDGGGFVPVHSASASFTGDFGDTPDELAERYISLVGGAFDWHGAGEMTTERIVPDHPVFEGVETIEAWEETYRHYGLADDIEVLAYGAGADYEEDEEEPFTWVREQGDGRVFYTAWGHDERSWETDGFKQKLHNAIRWASGNEETIGNHPTIEAKTHTHIDEYGHHEVPYYQGSAPDEVSSNNDGTWDLVQDPMSVADSVTHTVTPAEFQIEPFVTDETLPEDIDGQIMDMTFDDQGRCWIAVTKDYPNNGGDGNDMIVICEGTDDNGVVDDFTVFKDGLSIPLSIISYRDGVLVSECVTMNSNDGRVVYYGDEDGDGVADVEEELFSGFGTGDTHAGLNQLHYGVDNWIYGVVGYEGLSPDIDEDLSLSQDLFRFKPDGSEIELVGSGASNMAGVKSNEEGLIFCSSATAGSNVTTYAAIPIRYYDDVHAFSGVTTTDIRGENLSRTTNNNRILPINNLYRQVDQQDGFTAVTDQEFYTAREFPEQYWNSTTFVGEGTGQLLATFYLEQDGAGYESVNHNNLVTSNDEWFSPTYVNTGPDGQVWMIDFYNFVFQHNPTPSGYDNGPGNAYETNKRDGEYGRLYRITYGQNVDLQPSDLSDASPGELIEALTDDNMFWRMTAQRKLVEHGALRRREIRDLIALIDDDSVDAVGINGGAIHALWTLHGLDALEGDALEAAQGALSHPSAGVRLNAVRVLPTTEGTNDAILNADLLNDDDGRVRQWALLKLGETPMSYEAGEAVYDMITREENFEDNLLLDAATVAGARHHEGFIDAYLAEHDPDDLETLGPNELSNASFEDGADGEPDDWAPEHFGGAEPEFAWDGDVYRNGGRSARIDADEGTDAAWVQEGSVANNTDFEFGGYVRAEDFDVGDGEGIRIEVEGSGFFAGGLEVTDLVTEETDDWVKVSGSWNSGGWFGSVDTEFRCLFSGSDGSTGTARWDDVYLAEEIEPEGFHAVYTRVANHVDEVDPDPDPDDPVETLDPDVVVELNGEFDGWQGIAPENIEGETNPTLQLIEGEEYTVEWTNTDGMFHNFATRDDGGEVITQSDGVSGEGESETVVFTATEEMADYLCTPHPDTMVGDIEIVDE